MVETEADALAYKQMVTDWSRQGKTKRRCPTIVALDGFVLSSQGHFGGRNARKATSLEQLALSRQAGQHFQGSRKAFLKQ